MDRFLVRDIRGDIGQLREFDRVSEFASLLMNKETEELDIPPVREFLQLFSDSGGKIYGCKLALAMFKLKREDLWSCLDGILTVGKMNRPVAKGRTSSLLKRVRSQKGNRLLVETILAVRGMTCMHCSNSVARALGDVQGVHEARVDLHEEKAFVLGDVDVESLVDAIEEEGYDAELLSRVESSEEDSRESP